MKALLSTLFLVCAIQINAQTILDFFNPSFEFSPALKSTVPEGWTSCGFPNYSPPDIHGVNTQHFQVTEDPMFGEQYVGLLARADNTWEDLGQKLALPLEENKWHFFSFYARRAERYITNSRAANSEVNHTKPLVMIFYGSNEPCQQQEILAVSPLLDYTDWTKVSIRFKPSESYSHFWFEVNYEHADDEPYAGNVLIDNFSPIQVWTDTIRYFPLVAGDDFLEWVDMETITDDMIREKAMLYTSASIKADIFDPFEKPDLYYLYLAEDFLSKINGSGVRQILLNAQSNEILAYLWALDYIGAKDEHALFSEGVRLVQKSRSAEMTPEELERFDLLPELFMETGSLDEKISLFIESNAEFLINQMSY